VTLLRLTSTVAPMVDGGVRRRADANYFLLRENARLTGHQVLLRGAAAVPEAAR